RDAARDVRHHCPGVGDPARASAVAGASGRSRGVVSGDSPLADAAQHRAEDARPLRHRRAPRACGNRGDRLSHLDHRPTAAPGSGSEIMAYTRLTGRKRSLLGYTQLWLGPDHVLQVRSTRFAERYQRFSLGDIQAIVVTELPPQLAFHFLALAAVLACVGGFFLSPWIFSKFVFGPMAAIALAILIGNIALGPRCRCELHTAVSHEALAPVRRLRSARTFLNKIVPAIEAVQGTLAADRAAQIELPATVAEKPPEVPDSPSYLPETLC